MKAKKIVRNITSIEKPIKYPMSPKQTIKADRVRNLKKRMGEIDIFDVNLVDSQTDSIISKSPKKLQLSHNSNDGNKNPSTFK